jgi:yeast amino acid transporter
VVLTGSFSVLNLLTVSVYGEAEFWLSGGKVILIAILYGFTVVTMVGGNPKLDVYGFRYWNNPGPFSKYLHTGSLGSFEGFLSSLFLAALLIVGPEYVAMVAAEAKRPRAYIKNAYETIYWRFAIFFIGGAVCVGIIIPHNEPRLVAILSGARGGSGTAAASPYVIAMQNLGISGLPHLVNALLLTSIFSAGNTYVYAAVRTLYGLSLEGRAPAVFRKVTKTGVPVYCFVVVIAISLLSFLQVSKGSARVLSILISLLTGGCIINFIVMAATYIFFHRACQAQSINRKEFPYFARLQPYCAWFGLAFEVVILFCLGYSVFLPGRWDIVDFFSNYAMLLLAPITYFGWKFAKRTKIVQPEQADLVWERPVFDAYEDTFIGAPLGFWTEILQLIGLRRSRRDDERTTA